MSMSLGNDRQEIHGGFNMTAKRPTIKIGPQTANTVEIYIGECRILATETDIRIDLKGMSLEVLP